MHHPTIKPSVRDAPNLIGGVDYQALVSLLAWLNLREDEHLFLEVVEDYFQHGPLGSQAVQVKHKRATFTLNSEDARQMIVAAWEREAGVVTTYWSTARPGKDMPLWRRFNMTGVALWACAAEGDDAALEGLRDVLKRRRGWPKTLAEALEQLSPADLREQLFRRLHWELERPSDLRLNEQIRRIAAERVASRTQARARLAAQLVPAALREIFNKAKRRSPEDRYLSHQDLELLIEDQLAAVQTQSRLAAGAEQSLGRLGLGIVAQHVAALSAAAAAAESRTLDQARAHIAVGRFHTAAKVLDGWPTALDTNPEALGAMRRLRAEVSLALRDAEGAAAHAQQADEIDGAHDDRLNVRIEAASDLEAARRRASTLQPEDLWLQLELALLAGDIEAVAALLARAPASDCDGPYEHPIRILAYAACGKLDEALHLADAACAKADSAALRQTAAFLHYAAALAPGVEVNFTRWPAPIDQGLVRQQAEALAHLREAAKLFEALALTSDDQVRQHDSQIWRLACMIDLPEMRPAAEDLVARLLMGDAPHPGAVHWALARGLPLDIAAVETALDRQIDASAADAETIVARLVLLLNRGADAEARALLQAQIDWFAGADRALLDDWSRRLNPTGTEDPLVAAIAKGRRSNDWAALRAVELGSLPTTQRFMALEILAAAGQWDAVVCHADFLSGLGTAVSVRLAVLAASNVGDLRSALAMIETHSKVFEGADPPDPLTEIYIDALTEQGRLADALALLEVWAPKQTSPQARLAEVRLLLTAGDVEQVALKAAQGHFTDLPVPQRLQLANAIATAAPDQARSLLAGVDFTRAPVALAPTAFAAAEHAGVDPKTRRAILDRLFSAEAEAAGVIVAVKLDDLRNLSEGASELPPLQPPARSETPPLNLLSAGRLGQLFAHLLTDTRAGHDLLLRSAAAQAPRPLREGTLRLDITAALTAHALGLWPKLSSVTDALEISASLPGLLHEIEGDLRPKQAERRRAMAKVLAAVDRGAFSTLSPTAVRVDVVREDLVATCGDVLEALTTLGKLTASETETARLALGQRAAPTGLDLGDGRPIAITLLAAVELAAGNLLEAALELGSIGLLGEGLEAARREHAQALRFEAAAEKVAELRRWLLREIRERRVRTLPRHEGRAEQGPVLSTLCDLAAPGNAMVWVEDRVLHLHETFEDRPLVEAFDVLHHLARAGCLTQLEHDEALRRLREGGVRFLPAHTDEILTLLRAAPIVREAVVETPELAAVRRAFARDVAGENWLHLTSAMDAPATENGFLLELHRKLARALRDVWSATDASSAQRRAWSDWALQALRCDRFERAPINRPIEAERKGMFELQFLAWMDLGLQAGPQVDRRDAYLWAWVRLIAPELRGDPRLRVSLAARFARFWSEPFVDETGSPLPETARSRRERLQLCAAAMADMPIAMRGWLLDQPDLRVLLRPFLRRPITFGPLTFPADAVLEVVQRVQKTGRARNLEVEGQQLRVSRAGRGVQIEAATKSKVRIDGELLRLITGAPDERHTATLRLTEGLDLPAAAISARIEQIVAGETAFDRLVGVSDLVAASVEGRLQRLREAASAGELSVDLLRTPEPNSVRHWLRWTEAGPDCAALSELLPNDRLSRVGGLPWTGFDAVFADDEAADLAGQPDADSSPIGQLSTLRLAARGETANRLKARIEALMDQFERLGGAFVDFIACLHCQADEDEAWRATDPVFRSLAMWAWADALWRLLRSMGYDPLDLVAFWQSKLGDRVRQVVTLTNPCASAPAWVSAGRLLTCGLNSALGVRGAELWTPELGERISKFILAEARRTGLPPLGPLELSPDAALTWLAERTMFAPAAAPVGAAAQIEAIEQAKNLHGLVQMVAAGPDVLTVEAAMTLMTRIRRETGRANATKSAALLVRHTSLAVSALTRRGPLGEAERDIIVETISQVASLLCNNAKKSGSRSVILALLFGALGDDMDAATQILGRLFDGFADEPRQLIYQITTNYLTALPFEQRTKIWREHLRQRSLR